MASRIVAKPIVHQAGEHVWHSMGFHRPVCLVRMGVMKALAGIQMLMFAVSASDDIGGKDFSPWQVSAC